MGSLQLELGDNPGTCEECLRREDRVGEKTKTEDYTSED